MSAAIRGISSMATRQLLAELTDLYRQQCDGAVHIESVGGVDAARRVQSGEPFDVVLLASEAIDKLIAAGAAVAGSKVDLVHSPVAAAVRAGTPSPAVGSEEALHRAVLAAPSIGYSTGPSGTSLMRLFEHWGIAAEIQPRLKQAPPGVPVGSMLAAGEVALGFQQLSELIHVEGITIAGALPRPVQIITTFSGAVCTTCTQPDAVRRLLSFLASPEAAAAKRRHGMEPA